MLFAVVLVLSIEIAPKLKLEVPILIPTVAAETEVNVAVFVLEVALAFTPAHKVVDQLPAVHQAAPLVPLVNEASEFCPQLSPPINNAIVAIKILKKFLLKSCPQLLSSVVLMLLIFVEIFII